VRSAIYRNIKCPQSVARSRLDFVLHPFTISFVMFQTLIVTGCRMSTRRALAALISAGLLGSAAVGVSSVGSGTAAASSSHSGKAAAALIETTASGPAPNGTLYDY
jgi:hypothetical protein